MNIPIIPDAADRFVNPQGFDLACKQAPIARFRLHPNLNWLTLLRAWTWGEEGGGFGAGGGPVASVDPGNIERGGGPRRG